MEQSSSFIDELLLEVEESERKMEAAHADLVLAEIRDLSLQIEKNFTTAEQEKQIIDEWALKRNSKLNDRKELLSKKLEIFLNEQELKTLELANGKLLKRMTPLRVEITEMELFMKHAKPEMLSVQPEAVKPDLNKLKAYLKMSQKPIPGIKVIEGTEKFSIKLKQAGENNG